MKRVLMVAFHFPPVQGSSGIQRTLRFVRYLPEFGWQPIVLTAHARAYERVIDDQLRDIPDGMPVIRAHAWDAARHLSIAGRYPQFLARPDRWISWWPSAVVAGMHAILKYRPHALWSTFPIASAHLIGSTLQRRTGVPWVADFRDPMAQEGYPSDPKTWRSFKKIEEKAFALASTCVFTTPGAVRHYRERYPARAESGVALIENGYDEETFASLDAETCAQGPLVPGCITLLHSGLLYPSERDPTQLFVALRRLLDSESVSPSALRIRFRAPGNERFLTELRDRFALTDVVEMAPAIPYRSALEEMTRADGLLLLQASNCNDQIPAKLYEYLRAGPPILALTDPEGDTATTLKTFGFQSIAPLDCAMKIERLLGAFLTDPRSASACVAPARSVSSASRRGRTEQLAAILDRLPC